MMSKILALNISVILGALLLIGSYYHTERLYARYMNYLKRNIERSEGWKESFNEMFYALHVPDQWLFPLFGSLIAYLLIAIGIIATLKIARSNQAAVLYPGMVIIASIAFNITLLSIEKRKKANKYLQFFRLFALNAVITGSLIIGGIIRKADFLIILLASIVYFIMINLVIITPIMIRTARSNERQC